MSEKLVDNDAEATRLFRDITKQLADNGCAEEFVKLMDKHILHISRLLPTVADRSIVDRYIGEIHFCNGLRDGVVNALEANGSAATD